MIWIDKLTARELYSLLISNIENKSTSHKSLEKIFPNIPIKWDKIYLLPCKVTKDTYLRYFRYKILNNIPYITTSKLTNIPPCSFCKHENEITLHIFYSWNSTHRLWSQLKLFLEPNLILLYLLPQTAIFGFLNELDNQDLMLLIVLLLLFELNIYNSRRDEVLCFIKLLEVI